jgi:hypothetical protein
MFGNNWSWSEITLSALQELWSGLILFIPRLISALLVIIIGWILGSVIGRIIRGILARLKFDRIFEKGGWQEALEKAEIKVKPSGFIGEIGKWIVFIVFLVSGIKILFAGYGIEFGFLDRFVAWLPNLIVSVVIFIVAAVIADVLGKIIQASVIKSGIGYAKFIGTTTRWAIYVLATLMILRQLGVTPSIIDTIVMGLVGTFMLAFGLAFGLGGKEAAGKIIEDLRKKISE